MDNVQKMLLQIITHHRQNPLDFTYFQIWHLVETSKILQTAKELSM
jgi:hypothetical protein